MKHGFGTLIYPDGTKYEGDWFMNKRHGNGTLWIVNGKKSMKEYVGCWKHGMIEGFGTYHYSNGEVYKGEWKENKRQGNGRLEFPNGDYFVGDWANNTQQGIGILYLSNGNIFEGMWLNGKKDGAGKFFYASTMKVYEGEWVDDQPKCGEFREANSSELPRFGESTVRKQAFALPELGLAQPRAILDIATSDIRADRAERICGVMGSFISPQSMNAAEAAFTNLDTHGSGVLSLWVLAEVFQPLGLSVNNKNLHDIKTQLDIGDFATLSFPEVVEIALCLISGEKLNANRFSTTRTNSSINNHTKK